MADGRHRDPVSHEPPLDTGTNVPNFLPYDVLSTRLVRLGLQDVHWPSRFRAGDV